MQATIPHTGLTPDTAASDATRTEGAGLSMPLPNTPSPNPQHASTESTLAPTSEFVRYFLLAWPARYIFRGIFNGLMHKDLDKATSPAIAEKRDAFVGRVAQRGWADKSDPNLAREHVSGRAQNVTFGLGSLALTLTYSNMVYRDIFNLFSETVAFESGKDPAKITFKDIRHSDNRIVSKTVENWYWKSGSRAALDLLFFLPKAVKWQFWGDMVLGAKGMQLFTETWKREPTLFEHVAALVNSKINPKNGLGQPINVGEVFDLYQHYHFQFDPQNAFRNVLDNNTNEARIWAGGKPVFDRITELLNLTYSYKHATTIDKNTNMPVRDANFAMPKFLYLLGHDLIDPAKPAQTLMYIEIANSHGMEAVKQARTAMQSGASINDITSRYPVTIDVTHKPKKELAPISTKVGTRPIADEAPAPAVATIPTTLLASSDRSSSGTLNQHTPTLTP